MNLFIIIHSLSGALCVYDVTNAASFDNLEDWINIVRAYTKQQEKVKYSLRFSDFLVTFLSQYTWH